MPRHQAVGSLGTICLGRLAGLTRDWVLQAATRIFRTTTGRRGDGPEAGGGSDSKEVARLTSWWVEEMAGWIFGHVARSLLEEATLAVLKGVELAAEATKNTTQHRQIYIVVAFSDLIASPHLARLDLTDVPKILRLNLYGKLGSFRGLERLVLGSGSGGWSDCYIGKFLEGIGRMSHLVQFSLCYDCTDKMVRVLSANCRATLRVIDVEMSNQVTDACVPDLSKCLQLHTLHLHHTSLTSQGHASLLLALPRLQLLVRGGFLCEALEVLEAGGEAPRLQLAEFWSSEEYFFHSDHQMALLSRMCPNLRKIMFQFSTDVMSDLLVLATFPHLQELHLWGGDFYTDHTNLLLTQIGLQLTSLHLIHAENMDRRAVLHIGEHCPHLQVLGLYNCELVDRQTRPQDEEVEEFPRDRKSVV